MTLDALAKTYLDFMDTAMNMQEDNVFLCCSVVLHNLMGNLPNVKHQ